MYIDHMVAFIISLFAFAFFVTIALLIQNANKNFQKTHKPLHQPPPGMQWNYPGYGRSQNIAAIMIWLSMFAVALTAVLWAVE